MRSWLSANPSSRKFEFQRWTRCAPFQRWWWWWWWCEVGCKRQSSNFNITEIITFYIVWVTVARFEFDFLHFRQHNFLSSSFWIVESFAYHGRRSRLSVRHFKDSACKFKFSHFNVKANNNNEKKNNNNKLNFPVRASANNEQHRTRWHRIVSLKTVGIHVCTLFDLPGHFGTAPFSARKTHIATVIQSFSPTLPLRRSILTSNSAYRRSNAFSLIGCLSSNQTTLFVTSLIDSLCNFSQ